MWISRTELSCARPNSYMHDVCMYPTHAFALSRFSKTFSRHDRSSKHLVFSSWTAYYEKPSCITQQACLECYVYMYVCVCVCVSTANVTAYKYVDSLTIHAYVEAGFVDLSHLDTEQTHIVWTHTKNYLYKDATAYVCVVFRLEWNFWSICWKRDERGEQKDQNIDTAWVLV